MELSNKQNTAQPLTPLMMTTTTTMTVSDDGNVSGDNILSEVEEEEVPPLPFPSPPPTNNIQKFPLSQYGWKMSK